ncbi:MAG: TolC family protein [Longimicrobiales bacterium]
MNDWPLSLRLKSMDPWRTAWVLVLSLFLGSPLSAQEPVPGALTLDEALQIALGSNPGLQAERNDVAVADWDVKSAYGGWLPSASVGSSMSWQGAGEERFGGLTASQLGFPDQPSLYFSSYSLGVNYQLNGRMLRAPGQAKRLREATLARVGTAEATLRLNVTRTYLEVLRQSEGLTLAEQELARAEVNLRLAEGRQEVGSGNAIDVRQAEVNVGRAQVTLLQSETGVRTARIRLLQQLGVELIQEPALTTEFAVTEPLWTAGELYGAALDQNPGLQSLRANQEASNYGVSIARSEYYPTVSFQAGWSGFTRQASNTLSQEAQAIANGEAQVQNCAALNELVSRLADPLPTQDCAQFVTSSSQLQAIRDANSAFPFDFTNNPPSASMSISIPVFQGLSRQRGVEEAKAQQSDARYRVREQELALRADIEAQVAVVRTAYESALIEERNQGLADEQLRLAQERYRLGFSNFIELVEAETVKAQADRARIGAIYTYHDAIADLESIVGTPLRNP